jgi:hypothetical protein
MLFTLGVLGYLLYQYLEYAVAWAFGPLFLAFVVLYGASLIAIIGVTGLVAREGLGGRFSEAFPRRGWVTLSVGMSALLSVAWLGRIKVALDGDLVAAGLTSETTLTVQALDLGLVVPVLLLSAALVWQRIPVGYALATSLSVMFAGMAGAIVGMLLSAAAVEGAAEVGPIALFGVAAILAVGVGIRAFQAVIPPSVARVASSSRAVAGARP